MLQPANALLALVDLALLGLAVWALADAAVRKAPAFPAAGKQTKPLWLGILVASVLVSLFAGLLSFFGAVAAVAVIVYLVDVRPAVRELGAGPRY